MDLSLLPARERRSLFEYYKDHVSELAVDRQVELFEQFLEQDVCTEAEAVLLVRATPDIRPSIGVYLAQTMPKLRYARVFHETWADLDAEFREQTIKEFIFKRPEKLLFVAPFIDFNKYRLEKDPKTEEESIVKDTFGVYEGKNLLDKYFPDFVSKRALLETCLDAPEPKGLTSIVDRFRKENPYLLFPYFTQLQEHGLALTKQERINITGGDEKYGRSLFNAANFYTAEEQQRLTRGEQKVRKQKRMKADDQVDVYSMPDNLAAQRWQIISAGQKRGVEHLFTNVEVWRGDFDDQEWSDFLLALIDREVPVLYAADQLHLTEQEIKQIASKASDLGNGFFQMRDYADAIGLIKRGMENWVVMALISEISQGGGDLLIYQLDVILEIIKPANQKKLIRAYEEHYPSTWLQRLDFVYARKPIDGDVLIKRIADHEGVTFLNNFPAIYHQIKTEAAKQPPTTKLTEEDITEMARRVFRADPGLALLRGNVFRQVYSAQEFEVFVKQQFENDQTGRFLSSAMSRYKPEKEGLDEAEFNKNVAQTMLRLPFPLVMEAAFHNWEKISRYLPASTRYPLLLANLDKLDLSEIMGSRFESAHLLRDISRYPKYLDKLVQWLSAHVEPAVFVPLLQSMQLEMQPYAGASKEVLKKYTVARERLGPASEVLKRRLREVCATKKLYVFESGAAEIPGLGLDDLIESEAEDYVALHPTALLGLKNRLSPALYDRLVMENIRFVAFARDKYGFPLFSWESLTVPQQTALKKVSAFSEVADKTQLEDDYYRTLIRQVVIRGCAFYPLYQARLEAIAGRELEKFGPRTQIKDFVADKEFIQLIDRVSLLQSLELSPDWVEYIYRLPSAESEELVGLLEIIAVNGLDVRDPRYREIVSDEVTDGNASKKELADLVLRFFSRVFNVHVEKGTSVERTDFSNESLRVLSIYHQHVAQHPAMRNASRNFLKQVMMGRYQAWRSWGGGKEDVDSLEAMKALGLLPKQLTMDQYQGWLAEKNMGVSEMLRMGEIDLRAGVVSILEQAIVDQHMPAEDLHFDSLGAANEYALVYEPIKSLNKQMETLKQTQGRPAEIRELQIKIADYRVAEGDKIRLAEAKMYLLQLRQISMPELESKAITVGGQKIAFSKVFRTLTEAYKDHADFTNDLARLQSFLTAAAQKTFGGEKVSRSELTLTDRVDLETYAKIGESPVESCQHYNGSELNYGLLSYLTDPNVKFIQIYDDRGRIMTRAALRLLSDKEGNPALFLERMYSSNNHHKIKEAVVRFAKEKGAELRLPVLTSELQGFDDVSLEDPVALYSHGSRSGYVYTDAGGGKAKDGVYSVTKAVRFT